MCEFCTQHGEGEKWYLTMENYSKDLLDQNQRRKYAVDFLNGFGKRVPKSIKQLDKIRKTPFIGGLCNCDQDCMAHRMTHTRKDYPQRLPPMHETMSIRRDSLFFE